MATKPITFTKDHLTKLKELAVKALFSGMVIKGKIGTEINIYDLLHSTTTATLIDINGILKGQIEKQSNLDEWSMTEHQQKKLETLKVQQELVNLLIGYKKAQAEKQDARSTLANLKREYTRLKEEQMTPEERLKSMEAQMESIGTFLSEE